MWASSTTSTTRSQRPTPAPALPSSRRATQAFCAVSAVLNCSWQSGGVAALLRSVFAIVSLGAGGLSSLVLREQKDALPSRVEG